MNIKLLLGSNGEKYLPINGASQELATDRGSSFACTSSTRSSKKAIP